MMTKGPIASPSRTYVAQCVNGNFDGHYFRSFKLPEADPIDKRPYENSKTAAEWYFLNRLNAFACIEGCMPMEDYQKLSEQSSPWQV